MMEGGAVTYLQALLNSQDTNPPQETQENWFSKRESTYAINGKQENSHSIHIRGVGGRLRKGGGRGERKRQRSCGGGGRKVEE